MVVGEVEASNPCVKGAIPRRQKMLHADEMFFARTIVDTAFDVARFDDVRFVRREKKMID